MRTGRPIPALILSPEERGTLEQWARRPKTAQALAATGADHCFVCEWPNELGCR